MTEGVQTVPTINVECKNKKNVDFFQLNIFNFHSLGKILLITWARFQHNGYSLTIFTIFIVTIDTTHLIYKNSS